MQGCHSGVRDEKLKSMNPYNMGPLNLFYLIQKHKVREIFIMVTGKTIAEMQLTDISKTSCVSSSICTLKETCRPAAWVGGCRPGSRVDTPKLSGAPSLWPAVDDLSAGSTMATAATAEELWNPQAPLFTSGEGRE